jgi:Photosystem II complex subunit Ycf12
MNFEVFFQLTALFFILSAGPLVIILLSSRGGNL